MADVLACPVCGRTDEPCWHAEKRVEMPEAEAEKLLKKEQDARSSQ